MLYEVTALPPSHLFLSLPQYRARNNNNKTKDTKKDSFIFFVLIKQAGKTLLIICERRKRKKKLKTTSHKTLEHSLQIIQITQRTKIGSEMSVGSGHRAGAAAGAASAATVAAQQAQQQAQPQHQPVTPAAMAAFATQHSQISQISLPIAMMERLRCYLCDLPRSPWAMLTDYSELVCRGCVNYEGPDRIEFLLESVRQMKQRSSSLMSALGASNHHSIGGVNSVAGGQSAVAANQYLQQQQQQHAAAAAASAPSQQQTPISILPPPSHPAVSLAASLGCDPGGNRPSITNGSGGGTTAIKLNGTISNLSYALPDGIMQLQHRISGTLPPSSTSGYVNEPISSSSISNRASPGRAGQSITTYTPMLHVNGRNVIGSSVPSGTKRTIHTTLDENEGSSSNHRGLEELPSSLQRPPLTRGESLPAVMAAGQIPGAVSMVALASDPSGLRKMSRETAHNIHASIVAANGSSLLPGGLGNGPTHPYISNVPRVMSFDSMTKTLPQQHHVSLGASIGHQSKSYYATSVNQASPPLGSSSTSSGGAPPKKARADSLSMQSISNMQQQAAAAHASSMSLSSNRAATSPSSNASPSSASNAAAAAAAAATAPPSQPLKCTLCQERLEDTHFVQCPSVAGHKFCFPCSRKSIKRQQGGNTRSGGTGPTEVYCPSGEKCPLTGSQVPWAFMQGEISTILGGDDSSPTSSTPNGRSTSSTLTNDHHPLLASVTNSYINGHASTNGNGGSNASLNGNAENGTTKQDVTDLKTADQQVNNLNSFNFR